MTWTRSAGRVEAAVARLGAGPWTRQQLVEHGWTPRQIDRDVQVGRRPVQWIVRGMGGEKRLHFPPERRVPGAGFF